MAAESAAPKRSVRQPPAPGSEAAWRRRMLFWAMFLVPTGVALMLLGAFNATGLGGLRGWLLGSVGVAFVAVGALLGKFAVAGPVPQRFRRMD